MLNVLLLTSGFLEKLLQFDRWLLLKINHDWANSLFDTLCPILRHSDTSLPLYLFLFLFMIINFGWRSLPWMIILGLTAGVCDQVSSFLIKDFFNRVRPCRDPSLAGKINFLVLYCPGSGSFTSSHATNHFGAAMFIYTTWSNLLRKWRWLFFVWAGVICYSQVYVGVHYPFDVIGGAILGCGIGYLMATLFKKMPALSFNR
jgi:membrane-associated phospholipid phosphatase